MTRAWRERPISPLVWCLGALVLLYLLLPVLVIVPLSFSSSRFLRFPPPGWSLEWYRTYFSDPVWIDSTLNSFKLGFAVAAVATPLGTMTAYGLVRGTMRGKQAIAAFILSPMIIPVIVMAISIYGFFAAMGIAGGFLGLLVAHSVLAIPFVVVNVAASLQRMDPALERASLSLGASPVETFLRVTLPSVRPGILSGALFAFITSFDELVIAIFVGGRTMTLPRKIWDDLVVLIEPTQAAASVVLMAVSVIALAAWAMVQRGR